MTEDDARRIELSEDEQKRAVRAALETRAIADEQITRYAQPEEREEVCRRIDPATAQVFFVYAQIVDPYGDDSDLPEEMQGVGRVYFAVDPNEGVAVALYDLPEETREALADKRRLAESEGWKRLLDEQ